MRRMYVADIASLSFHPAGEGLRVIKYAMHIVLIVHALPIGFVVFQHLVVIADDTGRNDPRYGLSTDAMTRDDPQ